MSDFISLVSSRRSIRKFLDDDVPLSDIEYFIDAAVAAPSGCNSQCWHFVAVKDRATIAAMAEAVVGATRDFFGQAYSEWTQAGRAVGSEDSVISGKFADRGEFDAFLAAKGASATFFTKAPLVIAVFMTKLKYYDPAITELFGAMGFDHESMMRRMAYPDVLSIGAAVQNLLLAVHEKGYGACWMNEPAVAGPLMNGILGVDASYRFISLIPVGVPAYVPKAKSCKDRAEIFKFIG